MSINLVEGNFGKLGKGKTLRITIKSYGAFCEGREICSNIPLTFDHTPIKSIEDFLNLSNVDLLADELWAIGDNRKRNDLGELATIFCLTSRKRNINIRYTMQFLQIDVRIAFITTHWCKPLCYPFNPNPESKYQPIPQIMVIERWNGELEKLPTEIIRNIPDYFCLYDTKKDPYFVKDLIDDRIVKRVKRILKDSLSEEDYKRYNQLKNKKGLKSIDF